MLEQKNNTSGFESLIKGRDQAAPSSSKQGTGIAEPKSEHHISDYRAFVQKQLEKRKKKVAETPQANHPTPQIIETKKIVSQDVPQKRADSPIAKNTPSAKAPIGTNAPTTETETVTRHGAYWPIGDFIPFVVGANFSALSPIDDFTPVCDFVSPALVFLFTEISNHPERGVKEQVSAIFLRPALLSTTLTTPIFASDAKIRHYLRTELVKDIKSITSQLKRHSGDDKTEDQSLNLIEYFKNIDFEPFGANSPIGSFAPINKTETEIKRGVLSPVGDFAPATTEQSKTTIGALPPIGVYAPSLKKSFTQTSAFSTIGDYAPVELRSNYTRVPNSVFSLLPHISKCYFHIYLYLFRLSYGFQSNQTNISLSQATIVKKLGLNKRTVKKALENLISVRLIKPVKTEYDKTAYLVFYPTKEGLCSEIYFKNYFTLDNNLFLVPMTSKDFVSYIILYYYSFGFRNNCSKKLLTKELSQICCVHLRNFQDSIRSLIAANFIRRVSNDTSSLGISYRVYLPHEINNTIDKTEITCDTPDPSIGETALSALTAIGDFLFPLIKAPIVISAPQPISADISAPSEASANPPIGDSAHLNNKIYKNTSSGDADDFLNFIKSNLNPQVQFLLSKENIQTYAKTFGLESCKKSIVRLKTRLTTASNPVGLWIDSLKNPQNYPELTQKSSNELLQEQRLQQEEQRRVAQIEENKKQEVIQRVNTAWNALDEMKQNEFIALSEKYFREDMGMGAKLPPRSAVIERAKKMAVDTPK